MGKPNVDGFVDVECGRFVHHNVTLDFDTCDGTLDIDTETWGEWVDETRKFRQQNRKCDACANTAEFLLIQALDKAEQEDDV